MIGQWKRFRRFLSAATGVVWLLCCSGVVFIGGDEETEWLLARMALLVMLIGSTGVSIWLFISACRELRRLRKEAEEMRRARRRRQPRKKGPAE